MSDSSPLQIAIVGAGIAGLTAAIALSQHPHINIAIYEAATELKEIGASIALGPNGLRTLERLGLNNAISDEVAFRGPQEIPMIYRHWKTNEVIGIDEHVNVKKHLHRTARFHRAHLQKALLEHVPKDIIQLKKRIAAVDVGDEKVRLEFADGSIATADLLLGADGLRSGVRAAFVKDFPLVWSGWTAMRAVFDVSLVESIPDLPEDSAHWWGPETTFFASRLGKTSFAVVGGIYSDPSSSAPLASKTWDEEASLELFKTIYKDWNPTVKALTEITPSLKFHPNLSCSSPLDTWVFGNRATLIGDSAHAHGGAHATGGSIAIDDAYTLHLSLLSVFPLTSTTKPTGEEIGRALRLYEKIRKPHADRLLEKVHKANVAKVQKIQSGILETDEELRSRAINGSDTTWLHEHDVVKAFEEALNAKREAEHAIAGRAVNFARL